jgi:SAM-dependent methyltransferase
VASRFDRTADLYAAHAAGHDWSEFVEWCAPQPDDRALDVAAGSGRLAAALAPHVARAVALDPSEALLAHAPAGVETAVGSAERLPFDAGSFTLVTCVNGLHHVAAIARALGEMVRVLAPGGRLVLEDYVADDDPARARRWEEIERTRDPEHGRLPRRGEVRAHVVPPLRIDAERTWVRTVETDPWLALAGCDGEPAARVRALVGAPEFQLQVARVRLVRPTPR